MGMGNTVKAVYQKVYGGIFEALNAKSSLLQQGGVGNVFFVNGYGGLGNDGNHGRTPDHPFSTLTYAISQCVDYRHDVIIVLNYWQPAGEAWPIVVNKQNIHILGAAQSNLPWPVIHPPANTAVFNLSSSGQYSEIGFLTIGGGAAHGGIEVGMAGTGDGVWIHDCTFGHRWFGTPLNGICQPLAATHGAEALRIERCKFLGNEGDHKGAISANAIDMLKDTDFVLPEIIDCVFLGCTVAINLVHPRDGVIQGNMMAVPDNAAGEAVTLGANARGNLVAGNQAANSVGGVLGNNPWHDIAGAANNMWGANYSNEAVQIAA